MSKDLFSRQADAYAKYRPGYPATLIEYITGFVKEKNTVWDCATGNGQAAVLLASYFKKVVATDTSEKQIRLAVQKENIEYAVGQAEQTGFADNSFDLITVAQAYHWLRFDAFEKEVKRVAKPGAVIAVWGYNIPQCDNAALNKLIRHFYTAVVGKYWDAERKYIDEYYRTVPFNFEELPSKEFFIKAAWNKNDLPGYLNSWSSVQHFIKVNNQNPVDEIAAEIGKQWPAENASIQFSFPVFLRMGSIVK
jgi:ubiquinone/menaquinone biosynthesis C-methylase UbiE